MRSFTYVIQDPLGIHAKLAGMLVAEARKWESKVTIQSGRKTADAKRVFEVMGMMVKKGDTITISAEGEDEDRVCEKLLNVCKKNL